MVILYSDLNINRPLKIDKKGTYPLFSFQLDLVCDNKWWPSTSTSLFYVGSLIGNVLFGVIADKYGFFRVY